MILVLLGTQQNNFNRLLEEIESCIHSIDKIKELFKFKQVIQNFPQKK